MNKKFVQIIGLLVGVTAAGANALALKTAEEVTYNPPVFVESFNLTADKGEDAITLNFNPYVPTPFDGYKIVRSQNVEDPFFPENGPHFQLDDINATTYVDDEAPKEILHYKVCAISDLDRYCSNAVTVDNTPEANAITIKGRHGAGKNKLEWRLLGHDDEDLVVIRSTERKEPDYPLETEEVEFDIPRGEEYFEDKDIRAGRKYFYRMCKRRNLDFCDPISNNIEIFSYLVGGDDDDDDDEEPVTLDDLDIWLGGHLSHNHLRLYWRYSGGEAPFGFKVNKSAVRNKPSYPPSHGDTSRTVSDVDRGTLKDYELEGGTVYYYNVCQYDGESNCHSYSNTYAIRVPGYFGSDRGGRDSRRDRFTDTEDHRFEESVEYLLDESMVEGYEDGSYKPDQEINRVEFLKILVESKYPNSLDDIEPNCFEDVADEWFYPYVCFSKEESIIQGYPDGTFKPADPINFVEASKILAEFYGLENANGSEWYSGYVRSLEDRKYIPETIEELDDDISRGEMAEMVWRILEEREDQPYKEILEENH